MNNTVKGPVETQSAFLHSIVGKENQKRKGGDSKGGKLNKSGKKMKASDEKTYIGESLFKTVLRDVPRMTSLCKRTLMCVGGCDRAGSHFVRKHER